MHYINGGGNIYSSVRAMQIHVPHKHTQYYFTNFTWTKVLPEGDVTESSFQQTQNSLKLFFVYLFIETHRDKKQK